MLAREGRCAIVSHQEILVREERHMNQSRYRGRKLLARKRKRKRKKMMVKRKNERYDTKHQLFFLSIDFQLQYRLQLFLKIYQLYLFLVIFIS